LALITYIDNDGTSRTVQVESGSTVMRGAVDNFIEGIVAECGGAMSCATCHCYVDPAWLDQVGPPGDVEREMIDCTSEPRPNSRLSCQIPVTDSLDGLVVHLPESQY